MRQSGFAIKTRDEVDAGEWEDLLAGDPRSLLFQAPGWLKRYVRHRPRKRAQWLELRDEKGRLLAGLPFVLSSRLGLRAAASGVAGTYGGPVTRQGEWEAERQILRRFLKVGGRRCILREMLWGHEEAPAGAQQVLLPVETAIIDLSDGFEGFWSRALTHNRRNECNRSERRGLTTRESRDLNLLREFYPLYLKRSGEWGRVPHSLRFLEEVVEEEKDALLISCEYEGRVVGMHVCFDLGSEFLAWLGTSERLREVFPATMMVKAGVEAAVARGCRRMNLGSSLGLRGVSDFKKFVGAQSSRRWLLHQQAAWLKRARKRSR